MPRLSNKKTAELLATLSDSHRFLDMQTYNVSNMPVLMDMCQKANLIVVKYSMFDLKSNLDPKVDMATRAMQVQKTMAKNIIAFQDELERVQPFLIRCLARGMPVLASFTAALKPEEMTNVRLQGLEKVRNGILGAALGSLMTLNVPAIRDSYKQKMLEALAESARSLAAPLRPTMRRQIVAEIDRVRARVPEKLRPSVATVAAAMTDEKCGGLCLY